MNPLDKAIEDGLLLRDITPYSNVDPIIAANKFVSDAYVLPHIGEIKLSNNSGVDWSARFDKNEKSTQLWLFSLVFIDYLTKAYAVTKEDLYLIKAEAVFLSFFDWIKSANENYRKVFLDEHCVSNRLMILLQFHHVLSLSDSVVSKESILEKVRVHVNDCCNWLVDDANYASNNHGIMMDRALLSAFVYLKNYSFSQSELWKECALKRLDIMIRRTFDKDGCCTENSTSYHVLNVALFQAVKKFMQRNGIPGLGNSFEERLERAVKSLAYQVYEDGSLPLIGDSYSKPSVFLSKDMHHDVFGAVIYPESGLVFIKQRGLYFSFKCGGLTTSHRHVDDTSITLRVAGTHFICDGGMQSYDSKDSVRYTLSSYKSHSGVFTDDCASFRFKDYESPKDISKIVSYQQKANFLSAKGVSHLDCESEISREIVWMGSRDFFCSTEFCHPKESAGECSFYYIQMLFLKSLKIR